MFRMFDEKCFAVFDDIDCGCELSFHDTIFFMNILFFLILLILPFRANAAYLDQLTRSLALPAGRVAELHKAMDAAQASHMNKGKVAKLKGMADSLEQSATSAKSPADSARLHALAEILKHPAA